MRRGGLKPQLTLRPTSCCLPFSLLTAPRLWVPMALPSFSLFALHPGTAAAFSAQVCLDAWVQVWEVRAG